MSHLKRHKVPKNWPIPRKGTTYVVRPNYSTSKGIPILVILRDVLKLAKTRKEVKKAIHNKLVLHNNKNIKDEKNNAVLFDVITIVPSKKHYRVNLSVYGKFKLDEIKTSEANTKVAKIINKKTLKGKKTQVNLSDGRNFIVKTKTNTGDSAVVNFKKKEIEKTLALKEKSKAIITAGKHTGKEGIIRKLKPERKMASVKRKDENINVLIKQLMVIE